MEQPSVRVDVEGGGSGEPGDVPDPPASGRSRKVVGALLVVAAVVAFSIFALRPDPGEAADGTQRQSTTTTRVTTTTTSDSDGQGDERDTAVGLVVEPVEGLDAVDTGPGSFTVIPGPPGTGGYFGAPSFGGNIGSPELYRSLNGRDWIRVETVVVEDESAPNRPEDSDSGIVVEEFISPHARDEGLGVFRVRSGQDGLISSDLLVSADGVTWMPTDDVTLTTSSGDSLFPGLISGEVAFLASRHEFGAAVIERSGIETSLQEVCFVRPLSIEVLLVEACNGDQEEILRSEVPDEDAFDRVFDCLETSPTAALSSFQIRFPDGSTQPGLFTTRRQLLGVPVRLDSGQLVGFVGEVPTLSTACELFGDLLPDSAGPGIAIWEGPGEAEIIELDQSPELFSVGFFGVQPVPAGERLFALSNDGLWAFGLDGSAELLDVLDERGRADGGSANLVAIDDGVLITQVVGGTMLQTRIGDDGGAVRMARRLSADRSAINAVNFLYVDSDIVIFTDDQRRLQHIQVFDPS